MTSQVEFLRSILIFRNLPEESLGRIAQALEHRDYEQCAVLCR